VFGSGLGKKFLEQRSPQKSLTFSQIPHFGEVGVKGHQGKVHLIGTKKKRGNRLLILEGRRHFYEGIPPEELIFPYRVLAQWGLKRILLTNASGSLRKNLRVGNLVWIKDHINFMGINPLEGPNLENLGPRFPSLYKCYQNPLSEKIRKIARGLSISLSGGVYVAIRGPSYETLAEIKAFKKLGGDIIGMSTVPEAIASAHAGMQVAGLAAVTNSCVAARGPASHEEVLKQAIRVDQKLAKVLLRLADFPFK